MIPSGVFIPTHEIVDADGATQGALVMQTAKGIYVYPTHYALGCMSSDAGLASIGWRARPIEREGDR